MPIRLAPLTFSHEMFIFSLVFACHRHYHRPTVKPDALEMPEHGESNRRLVECQHDLISKGKRKGEIRHTKKGWQPTGPYKASLWAEWAEGRGSLATMAGHRATAKLSPP